MKIALYLSLQV